MCPSSDSLTLYTCTFPSSSDWRRGHGRKSSSNSLNSTSLRVPMSASVASIPQQFQQLNPLPQIGAGPHLETWEDLLAVNPRTDKKTRLKTYVCHIVRTIEWLCISWEGVSLYYPFSAFMLSWSSSSIKISSSRAATRVAQNYSLANDIDEVKKV